MYLRSHHLRYEYTTPTLTATSTKNHNNQNATMTRTTKKDQHNSNETYTERMHKCSAAEWEKRLESKYRDYHTKKLNNNKAGVVNPGSSRGFEGFSRRLPPEIRPELSFENFSLLVKTNESRIHDLPLERVFSKSDSYCLLPPSSGPGCCYDSDVISETPPISRRSF